MTLTSSYQYLGRSAALKSQNGSYSYYLLLYGASSGLSSGNHHVSIKLRLACTEGSSFYGFATSGAASAGGQSAFSWSWETNPNGAWQTSPLSEGGVTYYAWTDLREGYTLISTGYGAEKTVDLSGSFTFCDGTSGYLPQKSSTVTATVSCVLPAIAGASKPSCAATCQLGSPLAITVTGQSGLSHTLRYRFGSAEGVIDGSTWTPSLDLAYQIPYAPYGTATISCDTYSGSTPIGTEQTTVTLTVPESVVPAVSATVSDASGAEELVNCLVQNYSKLKVVPNAQGIYGSTILSTAVLLDGKAYTGGILTESGNHTITVTATDSRGRVGRFDKAISVAAYTAPTLKLSASRCTAGGTADEAGDHAKITVTGSVTEVGSGNACVLTVYWGGSYESVKSTSFSKIVEADVNTTMPIRATLSDKLITTERSMTLSTGYATLDLLAGGKGIAFGKAATREGFDCAMPAFFTGGVSIVNGTYNGDFRTAPEGTWWTQPAGGKCSNYPEGATYGFLTTTIAGGQRLLRYVQYADQSVYLCNNVNGWRNWKRADGIQPQLAVGTAYKTNDFYKGKSVYRKLISFGTLPASGEKNVNTSIAFSDYEIIDYSIGLFHSSGDYVYFMTPMLTFGFYKKAVNGVDYWHATAEVKSDLSAYTVTVEISYVKKE